MTSVRFLLVSVLLLIAVGVSVTPVCASSDFFVDYYSPEVFANWTREASLISPSYSSTALIFDIPGGSTVSRWTNFVSDQDYSGTDFVELRLSASREGYASSTGAFTNLRFGFTSADPPYLTDNLPVNNAFFADICYQGMYWRGKFEPSFLYNDWTFGAVGPSFEGVPHNYVIRLYPSSGDVWTSLDGSDWAVHPGVYPVGSSARPFIRVTHNHGNHGHVEISNLQIDQSPLNLGEPLRIRAVDSVTGDSISNFSYTVSGGPPGFVSIHGHTPVYEAVEYVPSASIVDAYLVGGVKEGYQSPTPLLVAVPEGGAVVTLSFRPGDPPPGYIPEGYGAVTVQVLDADTYGGVYGALFRVGTSGSGVLTDANGTAWITAPAGYRPWGVYPTNHYHTGGYVDVVEGNVTHIGVVYTVRFTSESLPPPPPPDELFNPPPDVPPYSTAHWRWSITEHNSVLGSLAAPVLDMVDGVFLSVDAFVLDVFHFALGPVVSIVSFISEGSDAFSSVATSVLSFIAPVVDVLAGVITCIPDKVIALATFALGLNFVSLLLRGPI